MINIIKSLFLIGIIFGISKINAQDTCLTNLTLGISFPPVADNSQRTFTKTHLDALGVTKIRFAEDWALREPTQGNFNWTPIDDRINWAYNNNYEIMLTIQSSGPVWACSSVQNSQSCVFNNNDDFKFYIDSLLQRHTGKIAKIQFGNEWQSDYWYAGDAADFIAANNILYNSVQMYSPSTQVVLGGFSTISLRFLSGCNGVVSSFYDDVGIYYDSNYLSANCSLPAIQNVKNRIDSVLQYSQYDMLDIHLYDDFEQWDEYYFNFKDTITKPIIVSEFGGPNINYEPNSFSYQANRLYQYIRKLDYLEIQEAYFFKLVEGTANPAHLTSGLISDTSLIAKPSYYIFKTFIECLPTSIQESMMYNDLNIFPNPVNENLKITFSSQQNLNEHLRFFNATGYLVMTIDINQPTTIIDVSNFSSGIYFIRLTNNPMQSYKFIKQ